MILLRRKVCGRCGKTYRGDWIPDFCICGGELREIAPSPDMRHSPE